MSDVDDEMIIYRVWVGHRISLSVKFEKVEVVFVVVVFIIAIPY